jgi:hypothetical protein
MDKIMATLAFKIMGTLGTTFKEVGVITRVSTQPSIQENRIRRRAMEDK